MGEVNLVNLSKRFTLRIDGKLHDVLRIEVSRSRRETGGCGMFDPLIDRQNRNVPRPGKPAVVDDRIEIAQHRWRAIAEGDHAIDEISSRQMKALTGKALCLIAKQIVGISAQKLGKV